MTKNEHEARPLEGVVAVVTGASRGAGRGIAVELGAAGATVYVTGRSTRREPADSYATILAMSDLNRSREHRRDRGGGDRRGWARRRRALRSHARGGGEGALRARAADEPRRLSVNNAGAARDVRRRLRGAVLEARARALGLDVRSRRPQPPAREPSRRADDGRRRRGLIVTTTFWDRDRYLREPLLRRGEGGDEPAGVRRAESSARTASRRSPWRPLDAHRVRPRRAQCERGDVAEKRPRANRVPRYTGRGRAAGLRSGDPGEERTGAARGRPRARIRLHRRRRAPGGGVRARGAGGGSAP